MVPVSQANVKPEQTTDRYPLVESGGETWTLTADHEHDVYTVVYPGGETWTLTADTEDEAIATVQDIRPGGGDPIAVHATGRPN